MHVIGTAGHVDHGKSTLVQHLTGIDPDRFAEEKRRGLTLDLGFAWLSLPSGAEVGIVDVPGHESLVRNMLAGAGGISICLFVVAATEGWKPQSAEHLTIVDALGVTAGVVALTKVDAVEAGTKEEVVAVVERKLAESSLAGSAIVPCSTVTGEGIDELLRELDRAVAATPGPADLDAPRLWVDRSFSMRGSGTVVTGTLLGGGLRSGDEVELLPDRRRSRIRSIQSHKREVHALSPGNRCALNLVGLERHDVRRGDVVTRPGAWAVTRRIAVEVSVPARGLSDIDMVLTERGSHLMYVGSAETSARVRLLDADRVKPGETALALLDLAKALPLSRGDRFVLRDAGPSLTVAGGSVLDPHPGAARRRDARYVEVLDRMRGTDAEALAALVGFEGSIEVAEAVRRAGTDDLADDMHRLGDTFVSEARLLELRASLREALKELHSREPLAAGMAREELRAALGLDPPAFAALLASDPEILERDGKVALLEHRAAAEVELSESGSKLVSELDAAGFRPPLERELDAEVALIRALVAAGALVRMGDFLLTRARAEEARAAVRAHISERGAVTVAGIRDLLGTTRKYAVPICEWLDATGATVRKGDERVLGPIR